MRKYDSKFDWTRNLSDEELIALLTTHIATSQKVQEDAKNFGFEFIDTSYEREKVIKEYIEKIVNSGKLDRSPESYEKYYR